MEFSFPYKLYHLIGQDNMGHGVPDDDVDREPALPARPGRLLRHQRQVQHALHAHTQIQILIEKKTKN